MGLFVPNRRYNPDSPEMMDRPGMDPVLLDDDLRQIRVINRLFGGLSAVHREFLRLSRNVTPDRQVRVLDIGTGSADHPVEIARRMRDAGRRVAIHAIDVNPFMVAVARDIAAPYDEITVSQADAREMPFADGSFDIVISSLAIHHFSRDDAVRVLREMKRLSRVGLIVNDLERSRVGSWIVWLYTRAATTNPITRHDAHASMLNAFTRDELITMSREAGIARFTTHTRPFFRLILVGERE